MTTTTYKFNIIIKIFRVSQHEEKSQLYQKLSISQKIIVNLDPLSWFHEPNIFYPRVKASKQKCPENKLPHLVRSADDKRTGRILVSGRGLFIMMRHTLFYLLVSFVSLCTAFSPNRTILTVTDFSSSNYFFAQADLPSFTNVNTTVMALGLNCQVSAMQWNYNYTELWHARAGSCSGLWRCPYDGAFNATACTQGKKLSYLR